jgi:ABC-2 type transport system ATP-binding protein
LLYAAEGSVWEVIVASDALPAFKQNHTISTNIRRSDGAHLRVVSETAPTGAVPASPTLEDAYLYFIRRMDAAPAALEVEYVGA